MWNDKFDDLDDLGFILFRIQRINDNEIEQSDNSNDKFDVSVDKFTGTTESKME